MTSELNGIPGATIGHGHLRVADLARSIAFYRDVIGMRVVREHGDQAAFMSFDDYHHHLGLNTWHSKDGTPPPTGHTGLFHLALLFPDRVTLGQAIARVQTAGYALTGAADHGVSECRYARRCKTVPDRTRSGSLARTDPTQQVQWWKGTSGQDHKAG